jgi:hypothetical protein
MRALFGMVLVLLSSALAYGDRPSSCAAVREASPQANDGVYTLYWRGNAESPWQAFCKDMDSQAKEYLVLPNADTDSGRNVSQAQVTSGSAGSTTAYTRVRIDPSSLVLDATDATFATVDIPFTTGPGGGTQSSSQIRAMSEVGTPLVDATPYAQVKACDQIGSTNIDLGGTPFSVPPNVFVVTGSNQYRNGWVYGSHNQVVDLFAGADPAIGIGGGCGSTRPADAAHLPLAYTNPVGGIQIDAAVGVGVGARTPSTDLDVLGAAYVAGNAIVSGSVRGQRPDYPNAAILEGSSTRDLPTQFVLQYATTAPDMSAPGTIQIKNITNNVVKTFVIRHPTAPARFLVHATIEGPEAAVYYRGTARLENGRAVVALPFYFEALTRAEGRTVRFTNVDGFDRLAVETQQGRKILNGTFIIVAGNPVSKQAFNWEVSAMRADVPPLDVQPRRGATVVSGLGPYTFIQSQSRPKGP